MGKLISVVVPVYNVEKYLTKCIQSIRNQTHHDLEIILVDDGSTDCSGGICDDFQKKDVRIKVIHKENGGLSDARNAGIDAAKGEYIAFVDSDDFIHPEMYTTMLRIMEGDKADIAVCGIKNVPETEEIDYNLTVPGQSDKVFTGLDMQYMYFEENFAMTAVVAWNKLYKKELFHQVRYPKGKIHEDEYTTYRLTYPCKRISYIDTPFYYYVMRSTSIMGVFNEKRFDLLTSYIERMAYFSANENRELAGKFAQRYVRMSVQYVTWYEEAGQDFSEKMCECRNKFAAEFKATNKKISYLWKIRMEVFLFLSMPKLYLWLWKLNRR